MNDFAIMLALCLSLFLFLNVQGRVIELTLRDIKPQQDNVYLCTSYSLNERPKYYLTGFYPEIRGHVHHIGVWGCRDPGSKDKQWDCSSSGEGKQKSLTHASRCKDAHELNLLYPWSYDTSEVVLPSNVSFEVGYATSIQYLVLEAHVPHAQAYTRGKTENSKVTITFTTARTPNRGGFFITSVPLTVPIPSKKSSYLDAATPIYSTIHPIFYQVHTHGIGTKVSGYMVQRKKNGEDKWTRLGVRDPRLPQVFVPVENQVTLTNGDYIAHRCHYYNPHQHVVQMGPSKNNEMCNFYVVYWDEWDGNRKQKRVPMFSSTTWSAQNFNNIPEDV